MPSWSWVQPGSAGDFHIRMTMFVFSELPSLPISTRQCGVAVELHAAAVGHPRGFGARGIRDVWPG